MAIMMTSKNSELYKVLYFYFATDAGFNERRKEK
jgi:hypothetical protein